MFAQGPPPPSTSPAADPLLRKDAWAATAPSVLQLTQQGSVPPVIWLAVKGSVLRRLPGLRQVRDEYLRFEVNMKMWEGPARDRKPLEMTKDASGYASWRDRTLTVVACKYPLSATSFFLPNARRTPLVT